MFRNYLKIAVRNLLRHKLYSLINILGLAVGIACCILLLLFVRDELGYDRFHEKAEQIYRVALESGSGDNVSNSLQVPYSMAEALRQTYPEVVQTAQVMPLYSGRDVLVTYDDKRFYEKGKGILVVDRDFLEIFTFPLQRGDPHTALDRPYTIVITQEIAEKYFGQEDPIGKVLRIENTKGEFAVTGVLRDVPKNSHLQFGFLLHYDYLSFVRGEHPEHSMHTYLYIMLREGFPAKELEEKLVHFHQSYEGAYETALFRPYLQPLTDIHLHSHLRGELGSNRQVTDLYLFSLIALLILLIACLNYMNLATARSSQRAKEVGVRKVMGARRALLVKQFLGESLLFSLIALCLALALAELFLPFFNRLLDKSLSIDYAGNWDIVLGLLGIGGLVGVLAGSYPALFLSALQPAAVLKGEMGSGLKSSSVRRSFVVLQFSVSIAFFLITLIVYAQREYMRTQNLGYGKESIVVIPTKGNVGTWNIATVKNEFLQIPHVLRVSGISRMPGEVLGNGLRYKLVDSDPAAEPIRWPTVFVDDDFIELMGMELTEGQGFTRDLTDRAEGAFVLNETARRQAWGPSSPVGARIEGQFFPQSVEGTIIGVVRDVHFQSLHHPIGPMVFCLHSNFGMQTVSHFLVEIRPDHISQALSLLKAKWDKLEPGYPFRYTFLDEDLERVYGAEKRLSQIFGTFALLAVFVACLGLFGLAAFAAEQRTKEIGIRKVLGASAPSIVLLLSKEFAKLVLVSNLIAWPIAYYAMNRWLQNFAYRIDIGIGTFVLGGMLALVIALLTVSSQAVKAALANPVDALRYE